MQSTGNDITQSSQANSPRRLTKQSALESPTNDVNTTVLNANTNAQTHEKAKVPAMHTSKKDEIAPTQRQRLRKIGPFAVDSQSIPDSRTKYAGAWPPPAYESDLEQNHPTGATKPNDPKQVNAFKSHQNIIMQKLSINNRL